MNEDTLIGIIFAAVIALGGSLIKTLQLNSRVKSLEDNDRTNSERMSVMEAHFEAITTTQSDIANSIQLNNKVQQRNSEAIVGIQSDLKNIIRQLEKD